MRNIPTYNIVQDPVKVQPMTNPVYQETTFDINIVKMQSNLAYQELSSHTGRINVTKQKPVGNFSYYDDINNDQNIKMTENPSYAVP